MRSLALVLYFVYGLSQAFAKFWMLSVERSSYSENVFVALDFMAATLCYAVARNLPRRGALLPALPCSKLIGTSAMGH